jgi:hypothetical protein
VWHVAILERIIDDDMAMSLGSNRGCEALVLLLLMLSSCVFISVCLYDFRCVLLGVISVFFAGATFGMALESKNFRDWYMSILGAVFGIYLIFSAIIRMAV